MDSLPNTESTARALRFATKACPQCDEGVALDSPHVRISRGTIEVFCTELCLHDAVANVRPKGEPVVQMPRNRRVTTRTKTLFVLGLGAATLSPCAIHRTQPPDQVAQVERVEARVLTNEQPELEYGPNPPTDQELADEFAASLGVSAWVHPLPGPTRRMPIRQSRAFGADRPGDRPYECRSGHCGVDIGGTRWGEQILASSDALVDKVNRNPSRSGGKYVRLSHYDGTVFTQYFHLAAIPRRLTKGQRVRAGDVIGLLGETGVDHSEPHLHFTVSVRASSDSPETYIDPEPLIALWPMRSLDQNHALLGHSPGVPIGATGRHRAKKRRASRAPRAEAGTQALGVPVVDSSEPVQEAPL